MEQHNSKPLGQEDFEDDDYEQDPEDDDDEARIRSPHVILTSSDLCSRTEWRRGFAPGHCKHRPEWS